MAMLSIARWGAAAWPVAVQLTLGASLILLVALGASLGLRRSAAAVRHRVWALAVVGLLVLPLMGPILPRIPLHLATIWPEQATASPPSAPAAESTGPTSGEGGLTSNAPAPEPAGLSPGRDLRAGLAASPFPAAPGTAASGLPRAPAGDHAPGERETPGVGRGPERIGWPTVALILWLSGMGIGAVSLVRSHCAVSRLAGTAAEPGDASWREMAGEIASHIGIRDRVRIGMSPEIAVPMAAGWLRPAVLLPTECERWPRALRRAVLVHELAHVARRDVLWQIAGRLARVVYWFHPLVWLAARRMRVEQEIACDDVVLQGGQRPSQYAAFLVDVAAGLIARPALAGTALPMVCRNSLEHRVRSILQPGSCRLPVSRRSAGSLLAGALAVVLLAGAVSPFAPPPRAKADPAGSVAAAAKQSAKQDAADSAADKKDGAASDQPVVRGLVVDVQGAPVAGVRFFTFLSPENEAAGESDSRGRFDLRIKQRTVPGLALFAQTADRSLQAYHQLESDLDGVRSPSPVRLVLKPARALEIQVVDQNGKPVPGAVVGVVCAQRGLDHVRSDSQGKASLLVPADAPLHRVYAFQSGLGLDYLSFPGKDRALTGDLPQAPDLSRPLVLKLDGAKTVRLRLVDPEDRPLAGISVFPWYFSKPKWRDDLNLSGLFQFRAKTDAKGLVAFDWIPAWYAQPLTLWHESRDRWVPARITYDPAKQQGEMTVRLLRTVPVRGKVRFADGRPAEGIGVEGRGAGYEMDGFHGMTLTDKQGQFEFRVNPDQLYLFALSDPRWAAPPRTGIVVRPDTPVDGVDFLLQPATRVHGQITINPEKKPLPGQYVALYQYGADRESLPGDQTLPGPTGDRPYPQPTIVRSATTDREGRYEFHAGPGRYDLRGPSANRREEFTVTNQRELVFDFHTQRPERGLISGRVVVEGDPAQHAPLAEVTGVPVTELGHADLSVTADAQGRFHTERWLDKMVICARSRDGTLAGVIEISQDDAEIAIPVRPVGSAKGVLTDPLSEEPLRGLDIAYGVRIHLGGPDSPFSHHFGGKVKTDAYGRFQLPRLVVGCTYHLMVPQYKLSDPTQEEMSYDVGKVTVKSAAAVDLGNVPLKLPKRP